MQERKIDCGVFSFNYIEHAAADQISPSCHASHLQDSINKGIGQIVGLRRQQYPEQVLTIHQACHPMFEPDV